MNQKSNIQKYKDELKKLVEHGSFLLNKLMYECRPQEVIDQCSSAGEEGKKTLSFIKKYPSFSSKYQDWYSEALSIVKLLLPDRTNDFIKLYEKPKNRKDISFENYVLEDCLVGLRTTRGWEKEVVVDTSAGIPRLQQQLAILRSAEKRFESSLFDIKQILQADLFDSELDAAKELNKNGYTRAAGAVAGVVLESHLLQACGNHSITVSKKDPSINDLNQLLKDNSINETSQWRFIQHLGDLRNKCDHKKTTDPTKEEITELIEGVDKVCKTIF